MRALSERDAAATLALVAELDALDDAYPFPPAFLGDLARLLRSQDAAFCELDRSREAFVGESYWADGAEIVLRSKPDGDHRYWRLRHSHPVCGHRERTDDWTAAHVVADFATRRQFERTAIYNEVYRHESIRDWLDVGLTPHGATTHMLIFTRDRWSYDERDRLILDLLQPHLQDRFDRTVSATEAAAALTSLEEARDDDARHVVLASQHGVIEFASVEARTLLEQYFGPIHNHLPPALQRHVAEVGALELPRGDRNLTVRAVHSNGLVVLLLGERDSRLDRLTVRQRTILDLVAEGHTDAEIAARIGVATATVKKHLEAIYARLGVHTRTAAAALVR